MTAVKKVLTLILATILGELALILLTTFAQEVLFDGLDYYSTGLSGLMIGGFATFLAAVMAGMASAWVHKGSTFLPQIMLSLLIIAETGYLIISETLTGPLWFDILSGFTLIPGIWIGYYYIRSFFIRIRPYKD